MVKFAPFTLGSSSKLDYVENTVPNVWLHGVDIANEHI